LNKILVLIFLFFFTLSATGQTYTYSYQDPCTGLEKNLEVPSNGVTVSYYGQISTFYPLDFYDGTFESWVQEQSNKYSSTSPCSTPIGLGTGLDIAQMSALNFLGIINSLTAASDFKSNKKKDPGNSNSIDPGQNQESGNGISIAKDSDSPNSPADSKNGPGIKSEPDKSGSAGEQKSQEPTNQSSKDDPNSSSEGGQKSGDQKSNNQDSQPANQGQNNQGTNSGQNSQSSQSGSKNQEGQTQAGTQKSETQDQQPQGAKDATGNNTGQGGKTDQGGTNASQGQQTQNTNGSNGSGTAQSGQGQQGGQTQNGQSGSGQQSGSNTNGSSGSGTTQSGSDQQGQTANTQNQQDGSNTNGQGSGGNSQLKTGESSSGSAGGENGQTTIDPKNPDSENKGTDLLGGSLNSMKSIPDKNGSGKPMIVGSSDFVGFNFRNSDIRTGTKSTAGYTSVKWDGSATSGILLDYTSAIRGPNLTGFHARLHERRIDVASVTLTNGFSGRGQTYGTLAIGQMFSSGKEGKFKTVWMLTGSIGQIYDEKFKGTAAIIGNMYDLKIGEKIDMKLMNLFVYAPYVSYYNDIVLKSPYVILPIVGTNLKISKNFKFNINIGGAYAIKENVMNYTITFGTRFLLQ